MITLRPANERGHANHGWLDSYHTFSFANYYDPKYMGFRALRVINEDKIDPGQGFGMHGHRDMEIVTYVLEGTLEHKDSLGNGTLIQPGEVQRMTAGSGIFHSEFNPSPSESVHLLQIWILPDRQNLEPGYEQVEFPLAERSGKLRLIAAPDGRTGAVTIHQDVNLYTTTLHAGDRVNYDLAPTRHAWLQVARGEATLNGHSLQAGDAAAVTDQTSLELSTETSAEVLLFDLA